MMKPRQRHLKTPTQGLRKRDLGKEAGSYQAMNVNMRRTEGAREGWDLRATLLRGCQEPAVHPLCVGRVASLCELPGKAFEITYGQA